MHNHQIYMQRCLQLAEKGRGTVAPNPMVGAVLVHNNVIIAEGYHHFFGGPHAEVDCLQNVEEAKRPFISESTLYVSLEPCCFTGKTPACTDLILQHKIPEVVIACRDPNAKVNGNGIEILEQKGVKIIMGILEKEAKELNNWFFTFQIKKRPYIILKWAQSANGKIASANYEPVKISNEYTNRLVHKWRSEIPAILVGAHTVVTDDPKLTNRYWAGKNPVRIVIDKDLKLNRAANIFAATEKVYIFNFIKEVVDENCNYVKLEITKPILPQLLKTLFEKGIEAVLVEGGAKTLQSFLQEDLWDEVRIITNPVIIKEGISAPQFNFGEAQKTLTIKDDQLQFYYNNPAAL